MCADGQVSSNMERDSIRTPVQGAWHMVTVSTLTNGDPVSAPAPYRCVHHCNSLCLHSTACMPRSWRVRQYRSSAWLQVYLQR